MGHVKYIGRVPGFNRPAIKQRHAYAFLAKSVHELRTQLAVHLGNLLNRGNFARANRPDRFISHDKLMNRLCIWYRLRQLLGHHLKRLTCLALI